MNGRPEHFDDDLEWDFLEGLWRQAPVTSSVPTQLRARVRREEWRMRAYAISEWLLAAVFFIAGIHLLATSDGDREFLAGFLLVFMTLAAMGFSLGARRGLWVPAVENTRAYLDISHARIRAGWRVLRYAWSLFAFEALLLIGFELANRQRWNDFMSSDLLVLFGLLGLFAVVLALWSAWYVRVLRRRETGLNAMSRELDQEEAATP